MNTGKKKEVPLEAYITEVPLTRVLKEYCLNTYISQKDVWLNKEMEHAYRYPCILNIDLPPNPVVWVDIICSYGCRVRYTLYFTKQSNMLNKLRPFIKQLGW